VNITDSALQSNIGNGSVVLFAPQQIQKESHLPADHADERRLRILKQEGAEGTEKKTLRSPRSPVQTSLLHPR
jgi:hypothetical protein